MSEVIVCVSGYFDPVHVGHLEYFKNLQSNLQSNYNFKLILNNFYKGNIIKREKHFFLIGKKLKI